MKRFLILAALGVGVLTCNFAHAQSSYITYPSTISTNLRCRPAGPWRTFRLRRCPSPTVRIRCSCPPSDCSPTGFAVAPVPREVSSLANRGMVADPFNNGMMQVDSNARTQTTLRSQPICPYQLLVQFGGLFIYSSIDCSTGIPNDEILIYLKSVDAGCTPNGGCNSLESPIDILSVPAALLNNEGNLNREKTINWLRNFNESNQGVDMKARLDELKRRIQSDFQRNDASPVRQGDGGPMPG